MRSLLDCSHCSIRLPNCYLQLSSVCAGMCASMGLLCYSCNAVAFLNGKCWDISISAAPPLSSVVSDFVNCRARAHSDSCHGNK
mmetsp:Transcript_20817/g.49109  ORF Transcript_20817/g.49109 Transcript_20817/m.49109 type:complete len:84 (-) Transcript_20817:5-256(-)